jgi:hypothetical protein
MPTQIQLRRGTSSEWTAANPVLAEGELGLETNTKLYKIGDGTSTWNQLSYRELSETFGNTIFEGQTSEIDAPPADRLSFYARSTAGRMLPRFKGPSGLDSALQPAFFGNGIFMASPGAATAMNVVGGPALTVVGTMSHPAPVASSLRQQMYRAQVLSAATAGAAAEVRLALGRIWRGDSAGFGGFFVRFRFSIVSTVAGQRVFVGLNNSTGAIAVTQDPTLLTQCIGIGNASDDTNLQLLHNDGAGACVKTDLGASFPSQGVDDIYDMTLFAAPNSSSISWRLERTVTPAVAQGTVTGSEMPGTGQFLVPHVYMNNASTAAAVQFDLSRLYIESDY